MQSFVKPGKSISQPMADLIGICVSLAIGVGGLIVVANPIGILFPKHPMISSEDWPGSRVTQGMKIIDARHWEEYRELLIRLASEEDAEGNDAEVIQRSTWYADPPRAQATWNESYMGSDWQLISENYTSDSKPASRLFCRYDLSLFSTACYYYAYRGHWYTEIHFSSWSDERLSPTEVQQIITRANQLLMSISYEP
jgi:hypothetical protein